MSSRCLGSTPNEKNVTMNRNRFSSSPHMRFEIHQVNSPGKTRDSPTSSILKTPTAIFVTTRSSSTKTRRLKFANGPVDLLSLKNGTNDAANVSVDSGVEAAVEEKKLNNGEINFEDSIVEVAISPVKTMQVSPESWKAFLEYKKYNDYANETEKTDYTYSRLSKFRHKEIIPGFLIRPNLSRSSISSRRSSSFSLPGSQSSFSESYNSGSFDFNVCNQSNPDIIQDLKISSQPTKFVRSKYNLRSSNLDWKEANEDDSNAQNYKYLEKDYYGQHSPVEETFTKSYAYSTNASEAPEPTAHYYTKVRSLDLDDADIDEVDVNPVYSEKHYYTSSNRSGGGGGDGGGGGGFGAGAGVVAGYNAERYRGRGSQSQTVTDYFKNFFTAVFLYVTSAGTFTRDLFSKYVLRREDDWRRSPSGTAYKWSSDGIGKSASGSSWASWGESTPYYTRNYYTGYYHGQPRSWYQRIFYYFTDRFSQLRNLIWGTTPSYASYRYHDPSRKRRFWWLLIPLLLLAGFWLFRAEQDSGFLSSRYKELDCSTNGLLTSMENTMKPVWRSGYVAYKRAAASASCYVNDSWERLKLPFSHINEWLLSKLSSLSEGSFGFLFTLWSVLWQGLWNVLTLARDTFSNLCLFLLDFFTDFISAVNNMLYYISRYFTDIFFTIWSSLGWIFGNAWKLLANTLRDFGSYLYLLLFAPRGEMKYEFQQPHPVSGEACLRQQKSIDKLTSEMEDFRSITWDLSELKKKIDELEAEFRKEKEYRRSQNELIDKQMDDNHKILQKYQATVNHALHSSKRPSQVSGSSVQYLLDSQSDAIKQWITQNFLLKSDSTVLDENKVALLIAKYGNKTGEDLLALRRELEVFVRNHKSEFESLRNNFNTLETNNLGGGDVSLAFIKKLISDAIKLYDADKTGRVDYALESAGGQVQSIRCTETYMESPKSYVLWRWSVYTETTSPREAIRPGMAAGQCWAFVGSQGFLVLQLSHTIRVTGFTMEHISKSLVPRGHIESAPKNFSMWGLKQEQDLEPYLFGEYAYLDNDETLQYFPVMYPTSTRYKMVELKITSNHGNPNYTCLYRIRVHGDLEPVHL